MGGTMGQFYFGVVSEELMKALSTKRAIYILPLMLAGAALMQAEDVVVNPVSVTTADGGQYNPTEGAIQSVINQQGLDYQADALGNLSAAPAGNNFTSGSTDWGTYFAGSPQHVWVTLNPSGPPDGSGDFEWFSAPNLTGAHLIFDMGSVLSLDSLALWNEDSTGIGSIALFACTDATCDSTSLLLAQTSVTANGFGADYGAQIFNFGADATEFVEAVVTPTATCDPTDPCMAIGEIAFGAAIPEPSTWILMGFGLFAMIAGRSMWERRLAKSRIS